MSFLGSKEDAAKYAKEADMQIDGLDTSNTSPVLKGSAEAGGAPMGGSHEFSKERTRRPEAVGQGSGMRRKYP